MFCGSCGSQLKEGAKFCPNCGAPAPAQAAPQGQPQQAQAQPQQQAYQQAPYQQQAYQQPQAQYVQAVPMGAKSKIAAGLLAIFLGSLGIHKFYMGYTKEGIIMLLITLIAGILTIGIAALVMEVIALIEGIMYLTKSDQEFYQVYELGHKGWF